MCESGYRLSDGGGGLALVFRSMIQLLQFLENKFCVGNSVVFRKLEFVSNELMTISLILSEEIALLSGYSSSRDIHAGDKSG